jgi:branched-subunit amino acid transport protein AzlD
MVLLVVYAVSDLPMANRQWIISLGSLMVVSVTQWFSKNALLSIALGSLCYMLLI